MVLLVVFGGFSVHNWVPQVWPTAISCCIPLSFLFHPTMSYATIHYTIFYFCFLLARRGIINVGPSCVPNKDDSETRPPV